MARHFSFLLFLAAAAGIAYFFWNYEFQFHYENGKLAYIKIAAKGARAVDSAANPPVVLRPTFRLASFDLGQFDDAKQAGGRAFSESW